MSTIEQHYINQFNSNIQMLAQQTQSRLMPYVRQETLKGEYGYFDQVGSVEAVAITTRHQDTVVTPVPHDRRRVAGEDWGTSEIIDKQDILRTMTDPRAPYTQTFIAAMRRRIDITIARAFFADAATGKTGSTTVSFPGSNQVAHDYNETASPASAGLTVQKLRRAKEILLNAEALDDGESAYCLCSARELSGLLRTTEVASSDYNTVKALAAGTVDDFMGIKFIRLSDTRFTQANNLDDGTYRRIPVWSKTGMLFAMQELLRVEGPTVDPTKNWNWRVGVYGTFGATRMEEARVVEIKVSKTVF